jgi:hypothetical protein
MSKNIFKISKKKKAQKRKRIKWARALPFISTAAL